MKSILITGGAGFIGINSAIAFAKKGYQVTVLDNLSRRGTDINLAILEKEYPTVRFVRADIRTDLPILQKLAEENDVVLHLAAQVAVTTSVTDPKTDFDINALGTFNVLEAIRMSKKRPLLIFASTNKVYGGLETVPVTELNKRYWFSDQEYIGVPETAPLDFHSPYGCSKGAADQYVRDYARIYGLRTIVFRQSCIYGQYQMGVEDQGWVAWFLLASLFKKPITIYGNGKQVRDLLHVDDLVRAYELAVDNTQKLSGKVFNLGGGVANALSLLEFFDFLNTELGASVQPGFADERPGDQPIFVSDNGVFTAATGWTPQTDAKPGIRALDMWLRQHRDTLAKFYGG